MLGQVGEGGVRRALADHQVDRDERLVHDGPGRVTQPRVQGFEDIGQPVLAAVRRDEYVLDVLCLRRRKLRMGVRMANRPMVVSPCIPSLRRRCSWWLPSLPPRSCPTDRSEVHRSP